MSIDSQALGREGSTVRSVAFNGFKMKGTDGEALQERDQNGYAMRTQNRVRGAYLLSDFGFMFQWHIDHSLRTCRRGGGHQMSQERGTRKHYGMEAVCMLEDVLMFEFVNTQRLFEISRRLTNTVSA